VAQVRAVSLFSECVCVSANMAVHVLFWTCTSGLVILANSEGFLSAQVDKQSVEQAFLEEMTGLSSKARLVKLEQQFTPIFAALPKNQHGNLDNPTVRFAIHRYFSHNFGWQVKGLTSTGETWNASSSTGFMKSRVSSYIFELFDKQLQGIGFNVKNLAVFASVMEDLVNAEAVKIVDKVFDLLHLSMTGPVDAADVDRTLNVFNAASMMGTFVLDSMRDLMTIEREIFDIYPRFENTQIWMRDVRHAYDFLNLPHRNPFIVHKYTYDDTVAIANKIMYSLGMFEMAECRAIKDTLIEMDPHAVGRAPLADYYASDKIDFHESRSFLRQVGSLDETDSLAPSIIIPNILGISGNCAMTTEYYSVCCLNECEGLLQQLEQAIAAPSASPARIAQIVSNIRSDTVEAPRNLSSLSLTRLQEIADIHGGNVQLHGRLFMQWMHYAYPRECQFPHVSGTVNPDSVWEMVTAEEKAKHMVKDSSKRILTQEEVITALPWSSVEELVVGHTTKVAPKSGMMSTMRFLVGVLAILSMVIPVLRSSKCTGSCSPDKVLCV